MSGSLVRRATAVALSAAFVLTAGSAWALDGWRDRRGMLVGGSIGAGNASFSEGESDSELGLNLRGRIGGGASQNATFYAELSLWNGLDDDLKKPAMRTIGAGIGGQFFIAEGFYLKGMAGLASLSFDDPEGPFEAPDSETGLYFGGGAGFEFFAYNPVAFGLEAEWQRQMYDDGDLDLISVNVVVTRY